MNPEQQAAYIIAQAVCAMAEIAGMQAENAASGTTPVYRKGDFDQVACTYGIHHNAVIAFFTGR